MRSPRPTDHRILTSNPLRPIRRLASTLLCFAIWLLHAVAQAADGLELPRCNVPIVPIGNGSCAFADYNGDHKLDVAFASTPIGGMTRSLEITVRLNGTDSTQLLSTHGRSASGVAFRDVDGDHDLDLVLTEYFRMPVAVFLNDGNGGFSFDSDDAYLSSAGEEACSAFEPHSYRATLEPEVGRNSRLDQFCGLAEGNGFFALGPPQTPPSVEPSTHRFRYPHRSESARAP